MRGELATTDGSTFRVWLVGLFLVAIGLPLGCAGAFNHPASYRYFNVPAVDDAWSPKISAWQVRDRGSAVRAAQTSQAQIGSARSSQSTSLGDGEGLRSKYEEFQAQRKRRTAREFMEWIQAQANVHYIADGPVDHWATLEETLRGGGDDCDGLELLVFHALRDQGFASDEVFRAIVHRPSDGQHHMVTLWFEQRDDPWVIDPTGAMTRQMLRMSQLPEWAPLKVFSDTEEYTVRPELSGERRARLAARP